MVARARNPLVILAVRQETREQPRQRLSCTSATKWVRGHAFGPPNHPQPGAYPPCDSCPLLSRVVAALSWISTPLSAEDFKRETFNDAGFVSIFDGKTLNGWHASAQSGHSRASKNKSGGRWVVEDGAIVGSQDIPGNGGIVITDKPYGNFEVALEMNNDFVPDSGLFLRSTEKGQAYQYMIDYHANGNLAGIYGEGLSGRRSPAEFRLHRQGDRDQAARVAVPAAGQAGRLARLLEARPVERTARPDRGQPAEDHDLDQRRAIHGVQDTEKRHPDTGGIALQVHGGGGDLTKQFVRYRNIRVKSLD